MKDIAFERAITLFKAGFIRFDVGSRRSFGINRLLRMLVSADYVFARLPIGVEHFCLTGEGDERRYDYHVGNAQYESYRCSNYTVEVTSAFLETHLSVGECAFLAYWLGIDAWKSHDFDEVAKHFGVDKGYAYGVIKKSLCKLEQNKDDLLTKI